MAGVFGEVDYVLSRLEEEAVESQEETGSCWLLGEALSALDISLAALLRPLLTLQPHLLRGRPGLQRLHTALQSRQVYKELLGGENTDTAEAATLLQAGFRERKLKNNAKYGAEELENTTADINQEFDTEEQSSVTGPTLPAGLLNITLHRARNLEKQDVFGTADPYCVLSLGGETVKTSTISNSQNPE